MSTDRRSMTFEIVLGRQSYERLAEKTPGATGRPASRLT